MVEDQTDGDAFTEAIDSAPTPRRRFKVDELLAEMPDDVAERRRAVLLNPNVNHRQCVTGFAAIGKQIGVSAIKNWRAHNGFRR